METLDEKEAEISARLDALEESDKRRDAQIQALTDDGLEHHEAYRRCLEELELQNRALTAQNRAIRLLLRDEYPDPGVVKR